MNYTAVFFLSSVLLAAISLVVVQAQAERRGNCRVRKEIHSLTEDEWQRLIQAFQRIKENNGGRTEEQATLDRHKCTSEFMYSVLANFTSTDTDLLASVRCLTSDMVRIMLRRRILLETCQAASLGGRWLLHVGLDLQ